MKIQLDIPNENALLFDEGYACIDFEFETHKVYEDCVEFTLLTWDKKEFSKAENDVIQAFVTDYDYNSEELYEVYERECIKEHGSAPRFKSAHEMYAQDHPNSLY